MFVSSYSPTLLWARKRVINTTVLLESHTTPIKKNLSRVVSKKKKTGYCSTACIVGVERTSSSLSIGPIMDVLKT